MKNSFIAFLILTSAATSFATHAYRSETCVSTTHKIVYNGNYPMGGSYTLSNLKTGSEVELYEKGEGEAGSNEFDRVAAKTLSEKSKKAVCKVSGDVEFDEQSSKSQMVFNISKLTTEDEVKVGIDSGTYMIFNCSGTFSEPVHCN